MRNHKIPIKCIYNMRYSKKNVLMTIKWLVFNLREK